MQITLQFGWPSIVPDSIIIHPAAAIVQMDIAWPEGTQSRCLLRKKGKEWSWQDPSAGIYKTASLSFLSWNWNLGRPGLGSNGRATVFHDLYTVCNAYREDFSASPFLAEFLKDVEVLQSEV